MFVAATPELFFFQNNKILVIKCFVCGSTINTEIRLCKAWKWNIYGLAGHLGY